MYIDIDEIADAGTGSPRWKELNEWDINQKDLKKHSVRLNGCDIAGKWECVVCVRGVVFGDSTVSCVRN